MEPKQNHIGKDNHHHRRAVRWAIFAFIGAVVAVFIGYGYSLQVSKKIDEQDRSDLLTRVQTIALLTNAHDIESLTGSGKDIGTPVYERVKSTLYNIHDINSGARFTYYMRKDASGKKLMFLADSEGPDSKDYSPPGQVYEDTSPREMENYINAVPFVEGPYTDQWGTWVSAYAPVWSGGKLVGIFGMDVSAEKWEAANHKFQRGIFCIAILAVLWYILLGMYLRRSVVSSAK